MKVVGFGACMINGTPFSSDYSFFNRFIEILIKNGYLVDDTKVVSLKGFPISRAHRFLEKRVTVLRPDIVVLQFGSTDVNNISVGEYFNKIFGFRLFHKNNKLDQEFQSSESQIHEIIPFKLRSVPFIKNLVKYCFCKTFQIEPLQSRETYISLLEEMIRKLNQLNIQVIVLSPFTLGDFTANFWAKRYTQDIKRLLYKYKFVFIDCHSLLSKFNKKTILLKDGLHISKLAHEKIADEMWWKYSKVYSASPIKINYTLFEQESDLYR